MTELRGDRFANRSGLHARAAAKFVHLASRFRAQIRVARDGRVMDGKSIMGILLLAAAHGTTITISADGADEQEALDRAVRAGGERIWRRDVERLTGIGVSPGVAVGRAVILTLRTEAIRFPIPPDRVEREVARAARRARAVAAAAAGHPRSRAQGARRRAGRDLRRADPDARRRAVRRPGGGDHPQERVNAAWAVHRAYEELGAVFASVEDEYLRERENDVADVAGRLRMNLRHGARGARDLLQRARRALDSGRRRADGVARGAARLDAHPGLCASTRAAARITRRSSRAR